MPTIHRIVNVHTGRDGYRVIPEDMPTQPIARVRAASVRHAPTGVQRPYRPPWRTACSVVRELAWTVAALSFAAAGIAVLFAIIAFMVKGV